MPAALLVLACPRITTSPLVKFGMLLNVPGVSMYWVPPPGRCLDLIVPSGGMVGAGRYASGSGMHGDPVTSATLKVPFTPPVTTMPPDGTIKSKHLPGGGTQYI